MLRLLKIFLAISLFASPFSLQAQTEDEIRGMVNAQIEESNKKINDPDFLKEVQLEREKLQKELRGSQGVNNSFNIGSDFYDQSKALLKGESVEKIISEAPEKESQPSLIVFITLSMPDAEIRQILNDASRFGASVAIRGMHGSSMKDTFLKMKSFLTKGSKQGITIDPTVFSRFEIGEVPAYVLAAKPVERCTAEGCSTPPYVKATGSVTLEYFLEKVRAEANPEMKALAQEKLKATVGG